MSKAKKITVSCPTCKTAVSWQNNPNRPFCSDRCSLIDKGNWADGSYTLESQDSLSTGDEQFQSPHLFKKD